jgi:hypothetical protein
MFTLFYSVTLNTVCLPSKNETLRAARQLLTASSIVAKGQKVIINFLLYCIYSSLAIKYLTMYNENLSPNMQQMHRI